MTEQQPEAQPAWPSVPEPAPVTSTSGNAIAALVLSIGAWVVCPIIPAIIALVFANVAKKEIASSGGRTTGQGLVTAANIVSWINIGFWAAVIAAGLIVVVVVVVAGSL